MLKQVKITSDSATDRELLANLEAYAKEVGLKPLQALRTLVIQSLRSHVASRLPKVAP